MLIRSKVILAVLTVPIVLTATPALACDGPDECGRVSCSAKAKLQVVQGQDGYAIRAKKEASVVAPATSADRPRKPVRIGRGTRVDPKLFALGGKDWEGTASAKGE